MNASHRTIFFAEIDEISTSSSELQFLFCCDLAQILDFQGCDHQRLSEGLTRKSSSHLFWMVKVQRARRDSPPEPDSSFRSHDSRDKLASERHYSISYSARCAPTSEFIFFFFALTLVSCFRVLVGSSIYRFDSSWNVMVCSRSEFRTRNSRSLVP